MIPIDNRRRIVREKRIDDGTTCGKTVRIDNYGEAWVPFHGSKDSMGTADTIMNIDKDGYFYTIIN